MITVGIGGGTGNQMFQYAIVRSLSKDLETDFSLNLYQFIIPSFLRQEHERYNLMHFNVYENLSTNSQFIKLLIRSKLNNIIYIKEKNPFKNPDLFEKRILEFKNESDIKDIFLRGNWGDERYFYHNRELITDDFKIITPPNNENQKFINKISADLNSVALCIRRGDYLSPLWKAQSGFTTIDYISKAVNFISEQVDNPVFYVFSNDSVWVKENIKLKHPTVYLSHNGINTDYEDLRLMSLCKHFIIGNSTFHWWGAWLSNNKDKIVIAPDPWFNSYTGDNIVPDRWLKLKCDRSEIFDQSEKIVFENNNEIFLTKNEKIEFKSFNIKKQNLNDHILKIVLKSKNAGYLTIKNNITKPIYIFHDKGFAIRYILLDEKILLNSLNIFSECEVQIEYIGVKVVQSNSY